MTFGVTVQVFILGYHIVLFCQTLLVHVINISH